MKMSNIIKMDELSANLAEAGFDLEKEIDGIVTNGNGIDLPRIRIEHKDNGKHFLYIDYGEDYTGSNEEKIGDSVQAVVFAEQHIRALWDPDEALPTCSSVDNVPIVDEPVAQNCLGCKEAVIGSGKCKPKVRLWMLITGKPYIMNLSPTSLKHWQNHLKRLKRSRLPVVSVNTVFTLKPIKRNGYSYAEVEIGINGIVSRENLVLAKQYRDELNRVMSQISDHDFSESGDKIPF
jgi:hypothetical protein